MLAIPGCVETETIGFGDSNGDEEGTPDENSNGDNTFDELLDEFYDILEELNVDVEELTLEDEYRLVMQTSGTIETDINRVASAYVTMSPDLEHDLFVRVEDRGLTEGTFSIELEWAQQHHAGQLTDEELVELIQDTLDGS